MGKKYEKNIKEMQDMVDGNYGGKIQVSMTDTVDVHANRKVGERYFDHDGDEWESRGDHYRVKISKMAPVGLGDNCSDCEKLILKPWDKDVYKWNKRCYYCQIDYEAMLKTKGTWKYWVRLQQLRTLDILEKEAEQLVFEIHEENEKKIYDMSVANAMANANVSMEIKKNKA